MCKEACGKYRLTPNRIIRIDQVLETGRHLRSLEFVKRTGLKRGLYPGRQGITVRYNEYMEHVIDRRKSATGQVEILRSLDQLLQEQREKRVAEMDQDHVVIVWAPEWQPTSPYVLDHLRWSDLGYKKLILVDEPEL